MDQNGTRQNNMYKRKPMLLEPKHRKDHFNAANNSLIYIFMVDKIILPR